MTWRAFLLLGPTAGWVGVLQSTAMDAIDCIAFNRTESKVRCRLTSGGPRLISALKAKVCWTA
jgi:hypothetical protein